MHFKLLTVFHVYNLYRGVLLIIHNKLFMGMRSFQASLQPSPVFPGSQNKYRSNFPMAGDLWRQIGEINK